MCHDDYAPLGAIVFSLSSSIRNNTGTDIHREPVKGTQKFSQAASAKLNTDDVKTAASSSWASFDKSVPDQPYYWVDPPEEEAPVRSALHAQAEDEDEEEDDPELEEDAVPPDLPSSARS